VQTNGVFVQDTWSMTGRLTLNLGVRFDWGVSDIQETQQMDNLLQNQNGTMYPAIPDLIKMQDISPRVGATYKLDQNGTTVVKFSTGRYFRKMTSSDASSQSPGSLTTFVYGWNPATRAFDTLKRTTVPAGNNRIDPDLTNEYSDQFHVGLERQLAPNFGINGMFVYKKEGNRIGTIDATSVYARVPYTDVFNGVTQIISVYNRVTPASQSILLRTNLPGLRQSYKSFVFEANRRMSGRWQAQVSYQWQREMQENQSSDPNSLINSYARSDNDNTHAIRASFVVSLGHDYQFGTRYFYNSGYPFQRLVTVRGLGQGNIDIIAEGIGAYSYPATNEVRFRVDKAFHFGARQRLRVGFDVLNVFNTDAATSVRNNSTQTTYPFGTLFSVIEGRRGQLALRYEF
jgi:outer membrane receptor protein involved in Fe transport